jgi:hypothetical protein
MINEELMERYERNTLIYTIECVDKGLKHIIDELLMRRENAYMASSLVSARIGLAMIQESALGLKEEELKVSFDKVREESDKYHRMMKQILKEDMNARITTED